MMGRLEKEPQQYDCGTLSLYMLCKLEGRNIELQAIEKALPQPPIGVAPTAFSMKELLIAAKSVNVELQGIMIDKEGKGLDRPMLVFMNRGEHGHFEVVRPVGHSGQLIQVLDPLQAPSVRDKADVLKEKEWTGVALAPMRQSMLQWDSAKKGMGIIAIILVMYCIGKAIWWNQRV